MMETKWTKGPWTVPNQKWRRSLTVETDGVDVQCPGSGGAMSYTNEICTLGWNATEEWLANAHLIAAAPELYEALAFGEALIAGESVGSEWKRGCAKFLKMSRAARAKARGETK